MRYFSSFFFIVSPATAVVTRPKCGNFKQQIARISNVVVHEQYFCKYYLTNKYVDPITQLESDMLTRFPGLAL